MSDRIMGQIALDGILAVKAISILLGLSDDFDHSGEQSLVIEEAIKDMQSSLAAANALNASLEAACARKDDLLRDCSLAKPHCECGPQSGCPAARYRQLAREEIGKR